MCNFGYYVLQIKYHKHDVCVVLEMKQQRPSPWQVHSAEFHWFPHQGQTLRALGIECWSPYSLGWKYLLPWTEKEVHCRLHPQSGSGSWPIERSHQAAQPLQSHSSSVSQQRLRSTASPGRSCGWWWRSPLCWPPPSPKARRPSCTQVWTAAATTTWCWGPGWGPGPCADCQCVRFLAAPPWLCSPSPGPGTAGAGRRARPPVQRPDLLSPYSRLCGSFTSVEEILPKEKREG